MPRFGKCSGCNVLHPAPFGSRCRYALEAKAYCKANNIPEKDFATYVDYDSMPKYTATDEIAAEVDDTEGSGEENKPPGIDNAPPVWVTDLIRINHEQRLQVDSLISRFDKLVTLAHSSTGEPAGATSELAGVTGGRTGIKTEAGKGVKPTQKLSSGDIITPLDEGLKIPPIGKNQPANIMKHAIPVSEGMPTSHGGASTHPSATGRDGSHAPADFIQGSLTSALDRLSMAIDPMVETKAKGSSLRPEFYVQHIDKLVPLKNIDHAKLNYSSLLYGMCRVAKHLLAVDGDVKSYLDHMIYITKLGALGEYTDMTFISYDRAVVDVFLSKEISTFIAGYPIAASLNFHASNMIRNQAEKQNTNWSRGRGRGRGRNNKPRQSTIPDGFPEHICYDYNYKNCDGCTKNHICRICNAAHKAIACPKKRDQRDSQ